MENLSGIAILTRKRALRNLFLLLKRDHGSDIMMMEMYEWYMSMDDETEQGIRQIMAVLPETQEKFVKTNSVYTPGLTPQERIDNYLTFGKGYQGRSKWERIGKPFVEDMVEFNAKIHFWNPFGKQLRIIHTVMKNNPDWDDNPIETFS